MKETDHEITQKVYFVGANGSEQGPFVRKYIRRESGLGSAYRRIHEAQRGGRRLRFIPVVFDCYDTDEFCVVVMEYVCGETLAEVVCRRGGSPLLAADVFPRLCDAVSELHEAFDPPIIHRDLKPSNIILSRNGLVLIDFGIARAYRDDAEFDTVRFGTRAYAPPEQFGYRQTDAKSDEYALGMLLYFCLTGKAPDSHVRERGFFDPAVPPPVRKTLMRATAFDPDDRFSTVRELRSSFSRAIAKADCGPLREERHAGWLPRVRNPFPLWMGIAWDAFLLLSLAVMGVSGVDQVVLHPRGDAASYPLWYNVFMYVGIMAMFSASAFALFDKRLPARRLPALRRVQGVRGLLVAVVVTIASFVAVILVGLVALALS